ncbi:hypothetical protein GDO86_001000 [Hymenochirus boettgeri]|uniref:Uncharacterized protein n=1 Tax=Hymenochirus boettgeri TaxID=247094 RepID=A0A8T2KAX3_9PIPI|nr:hypothetical protein GDO86_001000 [Hymenochirus boettgeri]
MNWLNGNLHKHQQKLFAGAHVVSIVDATSVLIYIHSLSAFKNQLLATTYKKMHPIVIFRKELEQVLCQIGKIPLPSTMLTPCGLGATFMWCRS